MSETSDNPGELYKAFYAEAMEAIQDLRKRAAALERREIEATGEQDFMTIGHDLGRELQFADDNLHKRIFGAVIRAAEERFAPPGGHLEIPRSDYESRFVDEIEPAEFDPAGLWETLEAHFGGEAGVEAGHRQAAERVIRFFGLCDQCEIQRKKGRVVLSVNVYLDEFDRRWGEKRLSLSCTTDLGEGLAALQSCAEGAGAEWIAHGAAQLRGRFFYATNRGIESRERLHYPGFDVVTYLKRFEFQLEADQAAKLQAFLGRYGADALKAQRESFAHRHRHQGAA